MEVPSVSVAQLLDPERFRAASEHLGAFSREGR
jgi:hypothetical protein